MSTEYEIVFVEKPEEVAWGIIGGGLHRYNLEQVGDQGFKRLCYVLRDAGQEIVGGVLGEVHWGWFNLDLMWIKPELRGRGYGRRLLKEVEEAARQHGAGFAYLDTFSFQALDFYTKHGYQVFGELADFPVGHQRYYLKKQL